MGKRGPKPKPEILRLGGETRPSRVGGGQAPTSAGRPTKPDHLSPYESQVWDELAKPLEAAGILGAADGPALAVLVVITVRWRVACQKIAEEGLVVETARGDGRTKSPWVRIAERTEAQLVKLMDRFGMTPAARAGLKVEPKREDPLGDYLRARQELEGPRQGG